MTAWIIDFGTISLLQKKKKKNQRKKENYCFTIFGGKAIIKFEEYSKFQMQHLKHTFYLLGNDIPSFEPYLKAPSLAAFGFCLFQLTVYYKLNHTQLVT